MSLQTLAKDFVASFEAGSFEKASGLLPNIKLELAKANLMVPNKNASKEDLIAARQVLEVGALTSIHVRNEDEINRLVAQIRPFYAEELGLPQSNNENKLVALHLLLLVARNEIAEFHTELEMLEDEDAESDQYLCYPIRLERWLMEGSYDKVWRAITQESEFPSPEFAILAESLVYTVRSEIALCSEKAYTSLPISNARNLLFLNSDQEIYDFVSQQEGWEMKNGRIYFPSSTAATTNTKTPNKPESVTSTNEAAEKLIANSLDYAREIETII